MHHRRATVAAVVLAALATSLSSAGAARAATWDASAIASHAMLYLDSPPAFREAMFREAAASGATSIRVDVPIPAIVRSPDGERSWAELDDVARLGRKYDLQVVGLIYGTPWWLAEWPGPPGGPESSRSPPRPARGLSRSPRGRSPAARAGRSTSGRYSMSPT